jgi:hypothetical protein
MPIVLIEKENGAENESSCSNRRRMRGNGGFGA